jgi:hypothetical protein
MQMMIARDWYWRPCPLVWLNEQENSWIECLSRDRSHSNQSKRMNESVCYLLLRVSLVLRLEWCGFWCFSTSAAYILAGYFRTTGLSFFSFAHLNIESLLFIPGVRGVKNFYNVYSHCRYYYVLHQTSSLLCLRHDDCHQGQQIEHSASSSLATQKPLLQLEEAASCLT